MEDLFRSSKALRRRMAAAIRVKIEKAILESENNPYEGRDWSLCQADNRGFRRGLRTALTLLGDDI
jgi:hypothetical protein